MICCQNISWVYGNLEFSGTYKHKIVIGLPKSSEVTSSGKSRAQSVSESARRTIRSTAFSLPSAKSKN